MNNEEKAMWLNRCLGAGLTVIHRYYFDDYTYWGVWDRYLPICDNDIEDNQFIVLEPHETIDNFSFPEGWV